MRGERSIQMAQASELKNLLASYPPDIRDLALKARTLLAELLPGAEETIDFSVKLVGFGYGPGYKGLVCTLLLSKSGVKVGIAHGAELPDPNKILQGSGKVHRHVPLRTKADLKQPGLKPLLRAALSAWKKRNETNG
jgi:hypothetical protein